MSIFPIRTSILLLFLLVGSNSYAFHLAGGEINMKYLGGNRFTITLNHYFDLGQNDTFGPDQYVEVYIFRNRDNKLIRREQLLFTEEVRLTGINAECNNSDLPIAKIIYEKEIELEEPLFEDEQGYSIVWERCCRNEILTNVQVPGTTGMALVLDFPPLTISNSTPILPSASTEYACVNETFALNLAAYDIDGDSLSYELVVPFNSSSNVPLPEPIGIPNMHISLASGFDVDNLVPGEPALNIDDNGKLSVKPNSPGVYAYAIAVREFRDGELIGISYRDYELLVLDSCPTPTNPEACIISMGSSECLNSTVVERDSLSSETCFYIQLGNLEEDEDYIMQFLPQNFEGSVISNTSNYGFSVTQNTLSEDSIQFRICTPNCSRNSTGTDIVDIVIENFKCPVPGRDTVRVTLEMPSNNAKPFFQGYDQIDTLRLTITDQGTSEIGIVGMDNDEQFLELDLINKLPYQPDPNEIGITLTDDYDSIGVISKQLHLPLCPGYELESDQFLFYELVLDDLDDCDQNGTYLPVKVSIQIENEKPYFNLENNVIKLKLVPGESYREVIEISDINEDSLTFDMQSIGLNNNGVALSYIGFDITQSAHINGELSLIATWNPDCLGGLEAYSYAIKLTVFDNNSCVNLTESIYFDLTLNEPECVLSVFESLPQNFHFHYQSGVLKVYGQSIFGEIGVYDLSGQIVYEMDQNTPMNEVSCSVFLERNQLYVIKVGNYSSKFIVR